MTSPMPGVDEGALVAANALYAPRTATRSAFLVAVRLLDDRQWHPTAEIEREVSRQTGLRRSVVAQMLVRASCRDPLAQLFSVQILQRDGRRNGPSRDERRIRRFRS